MTIKQNLDTSAVSLEDKYLLTQGRAFMTGTQAIVRLLLIQGLRDKNAGYKTAGFVSGYRGSPLGAVDKELWRARKHLQNTPVTFNPGVNEELAATSIWGTQQVNVFDDAKYEGVFGLWYGKGPGVDRSADALRHANSAGTSALGGVLAVAGDDHACKSSTLAHQTDQTFAAVGMPVLAPASVQDILDFGIHGWAMSRYSGCWVALKTVTDIVESSASVDVSIQRVQTKLPKDFALPDGGLSIRDPDLPLAQEQRLIQWKLPAAKAYARANSLDKLIWGDPDAKLAIVTSGKSYLDVRQALRLLGVDEAAAEQAGISLYKVGMVWPLEETGVLDNLASCEKIIVIEEKQPLLESQLRDILYDLPGNQRPNIIGKQALGKITDYGQAMPAYGELVPDQIALQLAKIFEPVFSPGTFTAQAQALTNNRQQIKALPPAAQRPPHFCSGCPHNRSTKVIDGSRSTAGIGCHGMATFIYPQTKMFCQMGGEGVHWIGQQPFTHTQHVFANMGEGTYFHSGLLAIRAAVAAKVPITYKILFNDAVAMTGGQPVDGVLTVPQISRQLVDEGVQKVVVVTDQPENYAQVKDLAPGVNVYNRSEYTRIQTELREFPAVSAIIYDQTCAAEKRRRRKRGSYPDPAKRVVINQAVCEGCGDCSAKSNCISIVPVETELGSKRAVDQSACNKDFSCVEGFCPSFVTVEGGKLRAAVGAASGVDDGQGNADVLPEPSLPSCDTPQGILVTGIGGTGVVTIGALLGMAAHLENKGVTVLDMAGLAQKGGAVYSYIRIGNSDADIHAPRIAAGEATALIGADIIVATSQEILSKLKLGASRAVINAKNAVTGEKVRAIAGQAQAGDIAAVQYVEAADDQMQQVLSQRLGEGNVDFLDATDNATQLMGDAIATNLFLLGYAYQKGLVPVHEQSLMRAIELNGTAVAANKKSFHWGRKAALDLNAVEQLAQPKAIQAPAKLTELSEIVQDRYSRLIQYQDKAYADRYQRWVDKIAAAEQKVAPQSQALATAVARYYFKLLAYKDEYEVARMHADPEFLARIDAMFEGDYKLKFNLAPPAISKIDAATGEPKKREFGSWMLPAFKLLQRFKGLRGTRLDPFARLEDRKLERQLIADYEATLETMLAGLSGQNLALAVELASVPEHIRGYGPVKDRYVKTAQQKKAELLARFV